MSGSGTNAGIEYQQRVASLLLTYQHTGMDVSGLLGVPVPGHIVETRFETDSPIDDISIVCSEKWQVDLQVKRTIALSEQPDSDFVKVVAQFAKAFVQDPRGNSYFSLVTTSEASRRIRYELRKIFESVRLNDIGFSKNPLNKSETETLALIKRLFQNAFRSETGRAATDAEFIEFSKRAFIAIVDVEPGMPLENSALVLLRQSGFQQPELVWALLIKNSLHYATERMSINCPGLSSLLDGFKLDSSLASASVSHVTPRFEVIGTKAVACGKEVLLIKSFAADADFMIVELFRFDEASQKKVRFKNGKLILGKDNIECEVIFRCSSSGGMERFIEAETDRFRDARVAILPANNIEAVEDTEAAMLYRAFVEQLVRANQRAHACLHCGKDVMEDQALLVEIDEPNLPAAAGLVHSTCRRPLDRVLGIATSDRPLAKNLPKGFDLTAWVQSLAHGQGLMNSMRNLKTQGRPIIIGWSSDAEYNPDYSFTVRFLLEDGSEKYSYERGKVVRLSKAEAEKQVREFAAGIRRQRELNDPWCFTSKNLSYGHYSQLLEIKDEDEKILEIHSVEVAPYTELLSKLYNVCENYYAPMAIARDAESEAPVCLAGVVPLISDPLQFANLEKNWRTAGFDGGALSLRVIQTDADFDNWMRTIFTDGLHPVIDPMFDKNMKLIRGVRIRHLEAMLAEGAAKADQL